jgi:hypothetical protein
MLHARVCSYPQANPTIGLVMFASFSIFLTFIFANLIIAILMDAYGKIRGNERLEKAGRDKSLLASRSEIDRIATNFRGWAMERRDRSKVATRLRARSAVRARMRETSVRKAAAHKLERRQMRRGLAPSKGNVLLRKGLTFAGFNSAITALDIDAAEAAAAAEEEEEARSGTSTPTSRHRRRKAREERKIGGAGQGQIKVKWASAGKVDEKTMVSPREVSDEHPKAYVAVAAAMLADEHHTSNLHALRRVLKLPSEARAEQVAMDVL